ncbi:MAG: MOSC domain-containing protein [Methylococcaceae bacterium]|nr:MAG: MOSC domain-containing protein [Methylococcaceae bacterium]
MRLSTISRGLPQTVVNNGSPVATGIFKTPVDQPVMVTATGLEGDGQADLENHGGLDKAVYAYTVENYAYWQETLGRPAMPHGQFGENFTVEGMPDEAVCVGDIFRVGALLMQVTQPRVPCFKLGIRMAMPEFVGLFMVSGRVGFYLRVLEGGEVQAGAGIERVHADEEALNIRDCMLALQEGPRQEEVIRRALSVAALSAAWRASLLRRIG